MYNDLYKAWKAEKTSDIPQPLPADFYQRVTGYLKGLQEDSAASDTRIIQGRLVTDEKDVAQRLFEELKEVRFQKIINSTRDGIQISNNDLTDEERTLLRQMNESLSAYKDREIPKPPTSQEEIPTDFSVVRFLNDVPEIVGVDLKIYGPYKKEDVGSLPNQNAQALVRQGLAKQIDVKRVPNSIENQVPILHQQ